MRSVPVDYLREPVRNFVHRLTAGYRGEAAIALASDGRKEPFRGIVLLGDRPAFGAGVAFVERRHRVTSDLHGATVFDGHDDRTQRRADAAEAGLGLRHSLCS